MTRSRRTRERERTTERDEETTERECPDCRSANLIQSADRGELVCDDCGLVVEEGAIDPGPEWRAFTYQEREEKSRAGAPDDGDDARQWVDDHDRLEGRRRLRPVSLVGETDQMHRLHKWQERMRTKVGSDDDAVAGGAPFARRRTHFERLTAVHPSIGSRLARHGLVPATWPTE